MATLNTQEIGRGGVTPSYAAATSGGDRFAPGARTFLHVKNGGGSAVTVTVAATEKIDGDLEVADVAVAVPAGTEKMIGPFPPQVFDAVDGSGLADVTYTGVTSVTVAALGLGT